MHCFDQLVQTQQPFLLVQMESVPLHLVTCSGFPFAQSNCLRLAQSILKSMTELLWSPQNDLSHSLWNTTESIRQESKSKPSSEIGEGKLPSHG